MPKIDFYFDFMSPYSYLAAMRIPEFERRYEVTCQWLPVNLPRLIKLSGNTPPDQIRNKALYSLRDLKRWAAYLELPFRMIKPGSFDSRPALRIAGALGQPERAQFSLAVFDAIWSGSVDPTASDWLQQIAALKSIPSAWVAMNSEAFEPNTHAALKAGVFGVPTFILHGGGRPEMFFGVDHMDFLARACDARGGESSRHERISC